MHASWSFLEIQKFLPFLLKGAWLTCQLSLLSFALSLGAGLALAMLRRSRSALVRWPVAFFVDVVRGTPILVLLFFVYYALPDFHIDLGEFMSGIVGLGVAYSVYTSEVYRGGFEAVDRGQVEAAQALGFSRRQAFFVVVLPQALRATLPALTNDFIALFKDSSLVSAIAMSELTKSAQILVTATHRGVEVYTLCAALYLAMSLPLAWLAHRTARRLGVHV